MKRFIATVLIMLVAGMAHAATQVSPATSAVPAATSASGTRERSVIPNPLLQQTIPTDQTVYYGPPFYCDDYWFGGCGLHANLEGAIQGWWAAYKAYWGVNDSNCSYYYTLTGSDGVKRTFVLMYIHGSACGGGPSGIYGTAHLAKPQVSFLPSAVYIPLYSNVDSNKNYHFLTVDDLALNLTKNDSPVPGVVVPLKSSRGKEDTISGENGTDRFGNDVAFVSTRQQPGTSTITSASSTIETAAPAVISWLPATYEGKFLVTCYGVANQKHQSGGPMVTIPGLPGKYHQQFYDKLKLQGSGVISDGKKAKRYIQKLWRNPKTGKPYKQTRYGFFNCPYTARGDCAKAGKTIAVDPKIIPMNRKHDVYADVAISGKGDRTSEDGGKWVGGYHIDLFYGRTWDNYTSCLIWGRNGPSRSPHTVTFENYVH